MCTQILSCMRRLWVFFRVKKFDFQYFFEGAGGGGVKKLNMFWIYEDFVDIFLGSSQNWTRSFLCILGSFRKLKVQNGGYFLGC